VNAPNGSPVHNLNTDLRYPTIQSAIDAAETLDGHVIFVDAGTYYEHVSVGKKLALIGENRDATIIDGNGTGTVVDLGTDVSISNFTTRNGEYGVAISSFSLIPVYRGNTVNNNRIMDNLYGAVVIRGCANNTISNNIIVNNTLFGIHLWHAGNNTLINNTVVNNGHGIEFYGNSNDNILRDNNMTDNRYNFGLIVRGETINYLYTSQYKPGIVNDVDTSNTVNGKPIYYWVNRSNEQVPSDAGYVWLNNCTNIIVNECTLSYNLQGIMLLFANNVSITNNFIADNVYGIFVWIYSDNNTLIGNTLENNLNGIFLGDFSRFTTMRSNDISGGQMNFGVSPDIVMHIEDESDLINDIDTSNTVDGKPIIYWINQHDQQVPTNAGYVMLINSTNILVEGLDLSDNVQNIFLLASNNTVIANNSVTSSVYGIDIGKYSWFDYNKMINYNFYSFNTTIKGNTLVDNGVGIRIRSDNSTISNNTLIRNPVGICLTGTSKSTISRNIVVASDLNITLPDPDLLIFYYPEWSWERSRELVELEIGGIIVGGDHNVVYGNTVMDSSIGICMMDKIRSIWGSESIIFHNNFINNTFYQALGAPRATNYWDNGYPSGGNYWSNYNGNDLQSGLNQNETGSDGIGDQDFTVFPGPQFDVIDYYPLMGPVSIFDAGTWNGITYSIDISSNSTEISAFNFNITQKTISFNVTGSSQSIGFCKVIINNVLLGGPYTVWVGTTPITPSVMSNGTHSFLYFTYNHSTKNVRIIGTTAIPEFSSFLALPLFMIATLIAVIVYKRRHSH
jgi:parallel beta-helix repeat protein